MKKILIIEDDKLIQRMYTKEFKMAGYEVEVAIDGEEGLLKSLTSDAQLILLDIMLPKKNGFEVLGELKKSQNTKNIPVIVLTNLMHDRDAEIAIEMGAIKYFVKSEHEPKDILLEVNSVLNKS